MTAKVYILLEYPNDYEADPIIIGVYNSYEKAEEEQKKYFQYTQVPWFNSYQIDEYRVQ